MADTPTVTGTTTNEDTQSATGLVISPNAADGASVTHFKITGISGGTLYQNDGITAIADGAFITVAEGRRRPEVHAQRGQHGQRQLRRAGFDLGGDAGLGGGVQTAIITVNPVNDVPVLTVNSGGSLSFHGSLTIGSALLQATDVDRATAQLTYTVTVPCRAPAPCRWRARPWPSTGRSRRRMSRPDWFATSIPARQAGTDGLTLTLTRWRGRQRGPGHLEHDRGRPAAATAAPTTAAPAATAAAAAAGAGGRAAADTGGVGFER